MKGLVYFAQDEIWSEIMAKRIKSIRDSTKEGIFGSIPYSFMTASLRSRYTSSFLVAVVCAFLFLLLVLLKVYYMFFGRNVRNFWLCFWYNIVFDVICFGCHFV